MSSRSLREGPEGSDTPSFTCEVCKISVRSAQKLLDHVNFSPLHKAALEGGGHDGHHSPIKGRSGQRRIIYDGTKLFWRINETLELCIYEDTGANCVTITAMPQQETTEIKVPPLLLDRRSLIRAAAEDCKHAASHSAKEPHTLPADVTSKFLLARLQAKKDARGHAVTLFLQKLKDDELEPVVLSQSQHHHSGAMPTDLAVRRRHTFDEVKTAQKEVNDAAVELKKARVQAENLSNLARVTLEVFSKRGTSSHGGPRHKSEWLRVYDRVNFKNAVDHSKDLLNGGAMS